MTALGNAVVDRVCDMLRGFGIIIVDVSAHPCTDKWNGQKSETVIIVGYIPGIACIFKVRFSTRDQGFIFDISGELKDGVWERINKGERLFNMVMRTPIGSEFIFCGTTFSINTYTGYHRDKSEEASLKTGELFFSAFLEHYRDCMAGKFTSEIHLWFVAEYSDEYQELEKRSGPHHRDNSATFNLRVMKKFPAGFFAPNQRP
jgi:hypothetical protein